LNLSDYLQLASFAPVPDPPGVSFNGQNGSVFKFSEPSRFGSVPPLPASGLYVILVRDAGWSPRPFRPLYFGKSAGFDTRPTYSHENYETWCRAAGGATNLFVSYRAMWCSTDAERQALETNLINYYKPECNKTSLTMNALYKALLRAKPKSSSPAFDFPTFMGSKRF
jgi:hypothetical protein